MSHFRDRPLARVRRALCLAALAAGALLSACGSSGSSTITVGNESKADSALAQSTAPSSSATSPTSTTPAATAKTPTSGPLSTEPKVTPPAGGAPTKLVVKDLIAGTGPEAKAGRPLTVNYVGVLFHGGKEFDASWKRAEPFTFTLGRGQVIPGWDQGVAGMKVGGRRELVIPAALAYGAKGTPGIPPNSPLVFVIDLLGA